MSQALFKLAASSTKEIESFAKDLFTKERVRLDGFSFEYLPLLGNSVMVTYYAGGVQVIDNIEFDEIKRGSEPMAMRMFLIKIANDRSRRMRAYVDATATNKVS